MDGISVLTSRANSLTPINSSDITVNHWNRYGFQMDSTKLHQQMEATHHSAQVAMHGHMNLFASGGNQSFNPLLTMIQPGSQPDVWHSNGRYPSATIFGDNGRNGLFSSPFGGRKRTLDDEHGDRVKRQRVCGASMTAYNGERPEVTSDVMETGYGINSSVVEHRNAVAAVHGYEDYLCNILISQLYGC